MPAARRCRVAVYPSRMTHIDRRSSQAALGLIASCVFALRAVAAPETEDDAALREQFRAAYSAAAVGLDTADDDGLRAYVLYPYLRAARLERALARAQGAWHEADLAAAAFIAETGDAPVARALRR